MENKLNLIVEFARKCIENGFDGRIAYLDGKEKNRFVVIMVKGPQILFNVRSSSDVSPFSKKLTTLSMDANYSIEDMIKGISTSEYGNDIKGAFKSTRLQELLSNMHLMIYAKSRMLRFMSEIDESRINAIRNTHLELDELFDKHLDGKLVL